MGVVLIANCSGSTLRIQRDACDQLQEEVTTCTMNAYKEYQNDFLAGEDGRPEWFARKACNYLTASIEDCYGKLIGDCATEEEVKEEEEAEETQTDEASVDSADNSEIEKPDDSEDSTETGNGENGEDEGPESSTEAAVASLSLVLVGYIMCSA